MWDYFARFNESQEECIDRIKKELVSIDRTVAKLSRVKKQKLKISGWKDLQEFGLLKSETAGRDEYGFRCIVELNQTGLDIITNLISAHEVILPLTGSFTRGALGRVYLSDEMWRDLARTLGFVELNYHYLYQNKKGAILFTDDRLPETRRTWKTEVINPRWKWDRDRRAESLAILPERKKELETQLENLKELMCRGCSARPPASTGECCA
jgi:hypothetical protein